jgi:hypothetical protein
LRLLTIEDIEAREKTGCVPHIPEPQRGSSVRKGLPHDLQAVDDSHVDVGEALAALTSTEHSSAPWSM